MIRLIGYLLLTVFLITILRSVIGFIMKAFGDAVRTPAPTRAERPSQPGVPLAGEFKKDPVCGTYISAATSIKQTVTGQTFYFCSPQCRDKFAAKL